jgi:hypothetical protein
MLKHVDSSKKTGKSFFLLHFLFSSRVFFASVVRLLCRSFGENDIKDQGITCRHRSSNLEMAIPVRSAGKTSRLCTVCEDRTERSSPDCTTGLLF